MKRFNRGNKVSKTDDLVQRQTAQIDASGKAPGEQEKFHKWNWWAFLGGDAWLFYHKMYKELGCYMIICCCSILLAPILSIKKFARYVQFFLNVRLAEEGRKMLLDRQEKESITGIYYYRKGRQTHSLLASILFFIADIFVLVVCGFFFISTDQHNWKEKFWLAMGLIRLAEGLFFFGLYKIEEFRTRKGE